MKKGFYPLFFFERPAGVEPATSASEAQRSIQLSYGRLWILYHKQDSMEIMEIPKEVKSILGKLKDNKFEAFLVGGCVRDLIMKKKPKDWDIASNASPEQIQKLFPESFCNNDFGTVNVSGVEITPFRTEEKYTDKRHPDSVKWAKTIEEDLSRRDFTVNAMALNVEGNKITDPFRGGKDLQKKIIKAVGKAEDRFDEDALRMMRAVRFATTLDFGIEVKTAKAIKENSVLLKTISKERIRDEFAKIINVKKASQGVELLRSLGLLEYIIPELLEGFKVSQNKHHVYDCYEHALRSLDFAAKKDFNVQVRLAALLHDIGKPRTKRGKGESATFYNHEAVGAKMTEEILMRLRFPNKEIEKIAKLVHYHLFYYNVGEVSESSVRRLLRNVGEESIEELLQVRMADRIGSGCPKAEPYKLRHLRYLIEKVSHDPISVKMLKADGQDIIKILQIKPGPKIGKILDILLGYVLIDPAKNNKEFLEVEIKRLGELADQQLEKEAINFREEREKIETKKDQMTKSKYWVT
jgi:tRNA nucleotidyltransferase (CCA-adding enzyme)